MKVSDKVERALYLFPDTRDDDRILMARVWSQDLFDHNLKVEHFFSDFVFKKYSDPETIRRCRQQLQAKHPELRGTKYEKRQQHGKNVTKAMRENPGYVVPTDYIVPVDWEGWRW